jgi:hypothetical protein
LNLEQSWLLSLAFNFAGIYSVIERAPGIHGWRTPRLALVTLGNSKTFRNIDRERCNN